MTRQSSVFDLDLAGSLNSLRALRVAGLEALAFARQAALLHRDLSAVYPEDAAHGEDVVVLLHGMFATAGVLRPLRRRVEREAGAHTASFSYAPGPGIERAALRLQEFVDALPSGVRLHLVGHSMGGVIVRWFMQELGGDARVVQTVSLGSPFFGTRHARLMPALFGDIAPESVVLSRLRKGASYLTRVPHLSIAAAQDSVVTESALWPVGEHFVIDGCGHNGLLFDERVADQIVRRVRSQNEATWAARSVA